MMQRIITGVVAGGIFLALLLLGGAYFQILVALLVIIAMQAVSYTHLTLPTICSV